MSEVKDYAAMHKEKLEALKAKVIGSNINTALELKAIDNRKLDQICEAMTKITGVPVWKDFNFRTGKIFGILRSIFQNPKQRQQLLEATGLTDDYIDIYYNITGNLPYVTKDGILNEGRPMDVEATKEFITIVAAQFGVVVEEADLADITQERWDRLYNTAMEKAIETVKHTAQYGETVPTQFDE